METLFSVYAAIFGLLIGSFLNVVILRLPAKKDLVHTRSACPNCGTKLYWFHNIPVLSFLALRGKCAFCGMKISLRYPLIECLTGLIAFWLFPKDISVLSITHFLFYFAIASVFICHFFIDLEHHLLLDSLNLYLLALILSYSIFYLSWQYWVTGGAIGFLGPLIVTWLFYKFRGQVGLGGGDIKLFGVLGILLGPVGIVFTIFLSCFVGAFSGIVLISLNKMTKDKPIAFGPYIILVAAFQIFFPEYSTRLQQFFFSMA